MVPARSSTLANKSWLSPTRVEWAKSPGAAEPYRAPSNPAAPPRSKARTLTIFRRHPSANAQTISPQLTLEPHGRHDTHSDTSGTIALRGKHGFSCCAGGARAHTGAPHWCDPTGIGERCRTPSRMKEITFSETSDRFSSGSMRNSDEKRPGPAKRNRASYVKGLANSASLGSQPHRA